MYFHYKPRHADLRIDMTPLIDVVLLLIIFFMVTSSFVQVAGIRVNLPNAGSAEKVREKKNFTVTVDEEGRYILGDHAVPFVDVVREIKRQPRDTVLSISSDKKAAFGQVMQVWDTARASGFKEIMVLTKEK